MISWYRAFCERCGERFLTLSHRLPPRCPSCGDDTIVVTQRLHQVDPIIEGLRMAGRTFKPATAEQLGRLPST